MPDLHRLIADALLDDRGFDPTEERASVNGSGVADRADREATAIIRKVGAIWPPPRERSPADVCCPARNVWGYVCDVIEAGNAYVKASEALQHDDAPDGAWADASGRFDHLRAALDRLNREVKT